MRVKEIVFVTGANGLLGANVCRQCVENGYEVRALVRHGSNTLALRDISCEIIEGDISDRALMENKILGSNYLIHCAAVTEQNPKYPSQFKKINVDVTKSLVEICKTLNIKKFIYVSSTNCFTPGSIDLPGNESGSFMSWLRGSGYAFSKYQAQEYILKQIKEKKFPGVVVAPSFMIGSGDAKLSSGQLMLHGLSKRLVFYPPGGKSFVDVDHVGAAIVKLIQVQESDNCYILSGENMSYKDFFKRLRKISGRKQVLVRIPSFLLVFISHLSDLLKNLFHISLPLTKVNRKLLCLDNYFLAEKAESDIQFKNTNIDSAISKAVSWFKINGYY